MLIDIQTTHTPDAQREERNLQEKSVQNIIDTSRSPSKFGADNLNKYYESKSESDEEV